MLQVSDILTDAKEILGGCSDERAFRKITDAVEILANKSDWDPLLGTIDICTSSSRYVTLPDFVETPLALNIDGQPSFPRDRWFSYHINGPGDPACSGSFSWDDKGMFPVFDEPTEPVKLIAFVQDSRDNGGSIWVYGYDKDDHWVTTDMGGTIGIIDGAPIPLLFGVAVPDVNAVEWKRITRVRKEVTKGRVMLTSFTSGSTTGVLIGDYNHDETMPLYRRIVLGTPGCWVRMQYRAKTKIIKSATDLIPLHSKQAVLMMLKAQRKFDNDLPEEGMKYMGIAKKFLDEEQASRNPPAAAPVQVKNTTSVFQKVETLD